MMNALHCARHQMFWEATGTEPHPFAELWKPWLTGLYLQNNLISLLYVSSPLGMPLYRGHKAGPGVLQKEYW